MDVEFTEDLLHWESFDGFDPKWVVPALCNEGEKVLGLFTRANSSTTFLDQKEREVDLAQLKETRKDIVNYIQRVNPIYETILTKKAKLTPL